MIYFRVVSPGKLPTDAGIDDIAVDEVEIVESA
jgi:hypothetical protein